MKPSEALGQAVEFIAERGWCQFRMNGRYGEACAIGALTMVCLPYDRYAYNFAVNLLADHVMTNVAAWNDAPGRTADEVMMTMLAVAAKLDAGGL